MGPGCRQRRVRSRREPRSPRKHLTISIVPDSGTGELTGIRGTLSIEIVAKQHHYAIDYTIEP